MQHGLIPWGVRTPISLASLTTTHRENTKPGFAAAPLPLGDRTDPAAHRLAPRWGSLSLGSRQWGPWE